MKISNFEYNLSDLSSHAQHILGSAHTLTTELGDTVKSRLSKSFIQYKINRLASTLSLMSDDELDKVGFSRKDIKRHAETLIKYEYDGP